MTDPAGAVMPAGRILAHDPTALSGHSAPEGHPVLGAEIRFAKSVVSRSRRLALRILLSLLLAGIPPAAWGGEGGASQLQRQYQVLRGLARSGPFGVPFSVQSEERDDHVTAEVYGIIEHPLEEVRAALGNPPTWCEFAPLHSNVKACTFQMQSHETLLRLYIGRRHYQSPEDASLQPYQFVLQASEPGFFSVTLSAPKGIFGTTAHRYQLEAAGVDGRTVVAFRSSYVPSFVTKVMTAVYLATVGRNKVGFSREDSGSAASPRYVRGFRGLVERNAMRYYLAFETFLDMQSLPAAQRFEATINAVYDSMERYPVQLHDMEKAEFLEAKRREREIQVLLQQRIGVQGPRAAQP